MEQKRFSKETMKAVEAGALLRARRKALGLTMREVVSQTAIPSVQYLQKLESGQVHPGKSAHLTQLANVLQLTPGDITTITGQVRPMNILDFQTPHLLRPETLLADNIPDVGAFKLDLGTDNIVFLDRTAAGKVVQAGQHYLIFDGDPPTLTRAVASTNIDGSVCFIVDKRILRAEGTSVIGRILLEGRLL